MEVLIILLCLTMLALFLWLNWYIAKQFESVACLKGYNEKKFFHFCFWLGMIGYLLVIALPNKKVVVTVDSPEHIATAKYTATDELPDL